MKQEFVISYVNGYGEHGCAKFSAYNLIEARMIAKNYCTHHMIKKAHLVTKSGKRYTI